MWSLNVHTNKGNDSIEKYFNKRKSSPQMPKTEKHENGEYPKRCQLHILQLFSPHQRLSFLFLFFKYHKEKLH